ncbi:DUF3168 domain-containing protein [Paracoccus pacificus]|uniref:DUF3168 domain-containing protein n=1 Tax=Paracoccus pacificus TaxID=1463598 RepID=A0ABW4R812_9RHOB
MSYRAAAALQTAVYARLRDHEALADLIGDAVFDAMPVEPPTGTYVALGPEEARDASDQTGRGAQHDFVVSVLSGADAGEGFQAVKEAAVAVTEALEEAPLPMPLAKGILAGLWFLRAKARRAEGGAGRRVDLTFRALVDLG